MIASADGAVFALTTPRWRSGAASVSLGGAFVVWLSRASVALVDWTAASALLRNASCFRLTTLPAAVSREGAGPRVDFTAADLAWRAGVVTSASS